MLSSLKIKNTDYTSHSDAINFLFIDKYDGVSFKQSAKVLKIDNFYKISFDGSNSDFLSAIWFPFPVKTLILELNGVRTKLLPMQFFAPPPGLFLINNSINVYVEYVYEEIDNLPVVAKYTVVSSSVRAQLESDSSKTDKHNSILLKGVSC